MTDTSKKVELIGLIMPHFNLILNFLPHSKPLKSYLTINSKHLNWIKHFPIFRQFFTTLPSSSSRSLFLLKLQVTIHNIPSVILEQAKLHFKTCNSDKFSTFSLQVPTTFSRISQKQLRLSLQQCSQSTPHKLINLSCKEKYLKPENHQKT